MKQIANYVVEDQPIATGGMGQIYKGYDSLGNTVAIKEILPEFASDLSVVARIDKEVEFLIRVDHPSIVKLYSAFRDQATGAYFIVMEMVDGLNIEQYINRHGAIPYPVAVELMSKILDAMQCVHDAGIVHRDIKPSNIMIRSDMSVCMLDFGVAKDLNVKQGNTIPGSVIGTTGYMSPEQAEGYTIDYRSDIYALGCVFFYMLTGHHAYTTFHSEFETKDNILNQPFPRLKTFNKNIPKINEVQAVLDKATDRMMINRFARCADFSAALPNKTIIPTGHYGKEASITVGRGQCDIIVSDPEGKVSRKHLEIKLKEFTGGRFFVLKDTSSNGTYIGTKILSQGEYTIPDNGKLPIVKLAGVPAGLLDWNLVRARLEQCLKEMPEGPLPESPSDSEEKDANNDNESEIVVSPDYSSIEKHLEIPDSMEEDATGWLVAAYFFAALGGLLGIICGMHVAVGKAQDYISKQKIYKYRKTHRQLGWGAVGVAIISAFVWIFLA